MEQVRFFFTLVNHSVDRPVSDDECYNDDWANAVGFDLEALGKLEIEFLAALDWRCHVSKEQFSDFLKTFEVQIAMQQAQKTGMFTYNTTRNIDIMGE